jgi:hypothetical protein
MGSLSLCARALAFELFAVRCAEAILGTSPRA